ncbi:MAG: helix-turn-helix domain-containing protein [Eubacterium sp.]|nr:helix-turn-helix domain-containing protein [Eubacterium sp.]
MKNQIETLKNIRADLGLNRKQFSEYMDIPLRTLEEWEAGRRKMPDFVCADGW